MDSRLIKLKKAFGQEQEVVSDQKKNELFLEFLRNSI
jgi:hypothetical protein